MPFKKGEPLASEAGKKGGAQTKKRLKSDPEYYSRIGHIGGESMKETHGTEFYGKIGRMGKRK